MVKKTETYDKMIRLYVEENKETFGYYIYLYDGAYPSNKDEDRGHGKTLETALVDLFSNKGFSKRTDRLSG